MDALERNDEDVVADAVRAGCGGGAVHDDGACERCGISRMTGHKWLRRFRQDGVGGLEDRCRASLYCPRRTDPEVVENLVEARHQGPGTERPPNSHFHRSDPDPFLSMKGNVTRCFSMSLS
jgi:hypothetical protein